MHWRMPFPHPLLSPFHAALQKQKALQERADKRKQERDAKESAQVRQDLGLCHSPLSHPSVFHAALQKAEALYWALRDDLCLASSSKGTSFWGSPTANPTTHKPALSFRTFAQRCGALLAELPDMGRFKTGVPPQLFSLVLETFEILQCVASGRFPFPDFNQPSAGGACREFKELFGLSDYVDYEFNVYDLERGLASPMPSGLVADILVFVMHVLLEDESTAPRTTFLGMPLSVSGAMQRGRTGRHGHSGSSRSALGATRRRRSTTLPFLSLSWSTSAPTPASSISPRL
jgi:hypothetical protein